MTKLPANKPLKQVNLDAATWATEHGYELSKKGRAPKAAVAEYVRELIKVAHDNLHTAEWTVISVGGGVDSASIIFRMATEGWEKFGIDPSKLILIMAQTGDEYPDLKEKVETYLFPLLREQNIRFVQVARMNSTTQSQFVVLDDSTQPTTLHIEGEYKLSTEMLSAGTVPQSGGTRLCSIKSKGWPLDGWIGRELGDKPFRHVIGFERDELSRVLKDIHFGEENRRPWYPLVDWDWDRAACLDYIESLTGVRWPKSCCNFCPFAGQGVEKDGLTQRWSENPELAADALLMEHTSMALNAKQMLFGKKSALDFVKARGLDNVLNTFNAKMDAMVWGVYRVRRVWTGNSRADRSVVIESKGSRQMMSAKLREMANAEGATLVIDGDFERAIHSGKGASFPCVEHMLVIAPLTMQNDKTPLKNFDEKFSSTPAGSLPVMGNSAGLGCQACG